MDDRNALYKRRSRKVNFFYLDDKLYKVLLINRPQDLVYVYCFTDKTEKVLIWTHTKKHMQRALMTPEVAQMINRHPDRLKTAIYDGHIPRPQISYSLDKPRVNTDRFTYRWSHKDVFNAYDYYCTLGNGRRRKDGIVVPWRLPTRAELAAMLTDDVVLYVKTKDGEFSPVWKEHAW
jgi:hypothetical protein